MGIVLVRDIVHDNFDSIMDRIANGEPLGVVAKDLGVKSYDVIKALNDNVEWYSSWQAAREARGEHIVGRMFEIIDDLLAGKIEPAQAKIAMQGYQWSAERYARASFGASANNNNSPKQAPVVINLMGASQVLKEESKDTTFELVSTKTKKPKK
jgi:hypothetical protein